MVSINYLPPGKEHRNEEEENLVNDVISISIARILIRSGPGGLARRDICAKWLRPSKPIKTSELKGRITTVTTGITLPRAGVAKPGMAQAC